MPGENDVLLNFVSDTDAMQPAEDAMERLIKKEGEVGEKWSKTSAIMNDQNKTSVDGSNKLSKAIEAMATAAKSMDKAVIGSAYKTYLKELQSQLGLTGTQLITYVQNAKKAAQEHIITAQTQQEVDELKISIEAMDDTLKTLGATEEGTGEKSKSLRARIKEMRDELARMEDKGQEASQAYLTLAVKAGKLDDQLKDLNSRISTLGSDTRHIDGLISLASGVAGGFAIAQGATALFGSENEEVQKALLKVNAAMSILQGLQAVQNVLQKESAASLLFNTTARTTNTVATQAGVVATTEAAVTAGVDAAAKGAETVATEAATVAQTELNVAMSLNPVGLIIAGVLALIGVLSLFSGKTKAQRDEQDKLNDAIKEGTIHIDNYLAAVDHQRDKQIAEAKVARKSTEDIIKIEGAAGNARLEALNSARNAAAKAFNEAKATDKESIEAKGKLYETITDLEKKYQDERRALEIKAIEFRRTVADNDLKSFIANAEAKVLATRSGSLAEKAAQIEAIKETRKAKDDLNPDLTAGEKTKNAAEDARAISDIELSIYATQLKSITAMDEAVIAKKKLAILTNKTDSIESINAVSKAEIEAIRARANEQIKSNPNLTGGEIAKIRAEEALQIAEQERAQELKILEIKKAGINAQIILAKKGSEEEFIAKVKAIENQQAVELAAAELTEQQIAEIKARAQDAIHQLAIKRNQDEIDNEISLIDLKLSAFGLSEQKKLELTLDRLDKEKNKEIEAAEGNGIKIAAIIAKYDKQSREAKIASIEAVKNKEIEAYNAFHEAAIKRDEKVIASQFSSEAKKLTALRDLQSQKEGELQIEFDALEKKKGLDENYAVHYQELLNKKRAIAEDIERQITDIESKEIDKRLGKLKSIFDFLQKGFGDVLGNDALSQALANINNFGQAAFGIFEKLKTQVKQYNKLIAAGKKEGASADDILAGQQAADDKEASQKDAKRSAEVMAIQATQDIINGIFADSAAERQQQLENDIAKLEEQKDKELSVKNLTEQQKKDINAKYAGLEKQEKIKAFNADKEAKKTQAIINGLLAGTLAFAQLGPIAGAIAAAIVLAETAIAVNKINNQQPPRFRRGKVDIQGPGTTTSDSITARISKGESVINADATAKWKGALQAINDNKFDAYLTHRFKDFSFPHAPADVHSSSEIDYDALADAVASKMAGIIPAPAHVHNTIDSDGLHSFVTSGNSRTEYKNHRYSMTP